MSELPDELSVRYEALERFRGGEGLTVRARERDGQGREVIVRVLDATHDAAPTEGTILTGLKHPRIPAAIEGGILDDGRRWLVREFAPGQDLARDPPSGEAEVLDLVVQVLDLLVHVHARGVLHLDLKPGNVLRRREAGGRSTYHLLDFGLARSSLAPRTGTGTGTAEGTPFFVAPEVLLHAPPDERADLFSLGAMAYVLLRRDRPPGIVRFLQRFPAEDFFAACGDSEAAFDEPLRTFLVRTTARDPRDRFASAADALASLRGSGELAPETARSRLAIDPVEGRRRDLDALAEHLRSPGAELWIRTTPDAEAAAAALYLALSSGSRIGESGDGVLRLQGALPGSPQVLETELPRLSAAAVANHLRTCVHLPEPQALAAAEAIVLRTGGAPGAVSRLLLTGAAEEKIVLQDGRFFWPSAAAGSPQLPAERASDEPPSDPDERAVLALLAAAREPLSAGLLAAVHGSATALRSLLATRRLARAPAGTIRIAGAVPRLLDHELAAAHRELARLTPPGRRVFHQAMSGEPPARSEGLAAIAALWSSGRSAQARELAARWQAMAPSLAAVIALASARGAEEAGEPAEVLRVLGDDASPRALRLRAVALADQGRAAEAEALLPRLDVHDASWVRAWLAFLRGSPAEALAVLATIPASHADGTEDTSSRARRSMAAGLCLARLGRTAEAHTALDEALAAARSAGATNLVAGIHANLGVLELYRGNAEAALVHHRESLALFRRTRNLKQVGAAVSNVAVAAKDLGRFREAEEHHRLALAIRRQVGDRAGEAASWTSLGLLRLDQGRGREAIDLLRSGEAIAAETGASRTARLARLGAIRALALCGRADEAESLLQALEPGTDTTTRAHEEAGRLLAAAEIALARGDAETARVCATNARLQFAAARDARSADRAQRVLTLLTEEPAGPPAADLLARARAEDDLGQKLLAWTRLFLAGDGTLRRDLESLLADLLPVPADRPAGLRALLGPATAARLIGRLEPARRNDQQPLAPAPPMSGNPLISDSALRTLLSINRRLATEPDLASCMRYLLDSAVALTGARRGFFLLQRGAGIMLELESGGAGRADEKGLSRSVVQRAIDHDRPVLSADASTDDNLLAMPTVKQLDLRSLLCVPFTSAGGEKGALYVEHRGRAGAFGDPDVFLLESLADQAAIAVDRLRREEDLTQQNRTLEEDLDRSRRDLEVVRRRLSRTPDEEEEILGESDAVGRVKEEIGKLAPTDISVLVLGETGTGKELVARALHRRSARSGGPFVSENCSAIPEALMESELFGHAKGAFTGAEVQKRGLLELAHGGTLFLDEIGDMPLPLQAKLLRVLEEGEVRPVGSTSRFRVDLRVIAATHRDLPSEARAGRFREDLLYRLAGATIRIPPLRERGRDVVLLAEAFLERLNRARRTKKKFAKSVADVFLRHAWPGNVRELQHAVSRLYLMAGGDEIPADPGLLVAGVGVAGVGASDAPRPAPGPQGVRTLAELEVAAIDGALVATGGDKTKAAKLLGISRTALYEKLKRRESGTTAADGEPLR